GSLSISRASPMIGGGIVAEKKSVCRRRGRCLRMRRMSGRKPMSSIRSASSRTRTSRCSSLAYGWRKWSRSRPGVATITSTPLRNACSCGPMPTPPKTAAPVRGVCTASSAKWASICAASSRVGARTRARVTPRRSDATLPPDSLPRMDRALAATCDHLLWGAADLDVAVATLAERTEVRATAGGQHPDLGTHNAIAALGRKRFLEVIAPDPTLRPGALARWLASIKAPTLIMWAARTPSAADTAARAEASGYQAAVVEGHRARPDGKLVRWTNVFVSGHGGGTLVPFFV